MAVSKVRILIIGLCVREDVGKGWPLGEKTAISRSNSFPAPDSIIGRGDFDIIGKVRYDRRQDVLDR